MFKLTITSFFSIMFLLIPVNEKSVSIKRNDKSFEYTLHLKECSESRIVNLSDMVENFEFIPLETGKESNISNGLYYVTKKYILVVDIKHAIIQFDRSGKFIRTLVHEGPGPGEYRTAYDKLYLTVDEESQTLYIPDMYKAKYFLRYDLASGRYLGDLPKPVNCQNQVALMCPNKTLMVIPNSFDIKEKNPFVIFWQDLNGKFVHGIRGSENRLTGIQSSSAYTFKDEFRFFSPETDTVFSICNFQTRPFIIYDFGDKQVRKLKYEGRQSLFVKFESGRWLSIMDNIVNEARRNIKGQVTGMSVVTVYYMLDKTEPKLYKDCPIFFDPIHYKTGCSVVESMNFQSNGLFNFSYSANNLLKYAEEAFKDPSFKEPYRSKLKALVDRVSKDDNRVLLIGAIKY